MQSTSTSSATSLPAMLHITNGDAAADIIRRSALTGAVIAWNDVLHEGPLPASLSPDELRMVRARFIADAGWGEFDDVFASFSRRDQRLANAAGEDEIVLWFEHDLYDQLQLIQILDRLRGLDLSDTRLSMVVVEEYLGHLSSSRIRELYPTRRPITGDDLALGSRAWEAFRSPDPTSVQSLIDHLLDDENARARLPFLSAALIRHLEELPSTDNGLSRTELQTLEAIAEGTTLLRDLYREAHHARERAIFLGDYPFLWRLAFLGANDDPLVRWKNEGSMTSSDIDYSSYEHWNREVALTDTGKRVLDGKIDYVALGTIDRWLGGVHLYGTNVPWRWDAEIERVRESGIDVDGMRGDR